MSLIDDALKRAQAADEAASRRGDRPWIPTPMPDAGLARRRRLLRGLAIAAGAAAAVGAAFVAWRWAVAPGEARPAAAPAAVSPAPARPVDVQWTPVTVATPVTPRASGAVAPAAGTPRPRATRAPKPPQEAGAPVAAPPAPGKPAAAAPVGGKTYAGGVTLPDGGKIELGGIVWSESEPRALLNDRVLGIGAYVEGYVLVRIEEDRVVLDKDGATLTLTVR
ncbi:MAG TPA: hypothetical protein VMH79_13155 [Thermoanaerobaculia bacterium]|nr:hypothetical protein [Thermoanaerobaculia bacterium]